MTTFLLGGYGVAWGSHPRWIDGGETYSVRPNAIRVARSAFLSAHDHDSDDELACVANRTLETWVDGHGVAFLAELAASPAVYGLLAAVKRDACYCSCELSDLETEDNGPGELTVIAGTVQHITAGLSYPRSERTGAFLVEFPTEALDRGLQAMRRTWGASHAAYREGWIKSATAAPKRPVAAPRPTPKTRAPTRPITVPAARVVRKTELPPQSRQITPERARAAFYARLSKHPSYGRMRAVYEAAFRARGMEPPQ